MCDCVKTFFWKRVHRYSLFPGDDRTVSGKTLGEDHRGVMISYAVNNNKNIDFKISLQGGTP